MILTLRVSPIHQHSPVPSWVLHCTLKSSSTLPCTPAHFHKHLCPFCVFLRTTTNDPAHSGALPRTPAQSRASRALPRTPAHSHLLLCTLALSHALPCTKHRPFCIFLNTPTLSHNLPATTLGANHSQSDEIILRIMRSFSE